MTQIHATIHEYMYLCSLPLVTDNRSQDITSPDTFYDTLYTVFRNSHQITNINSGFFAQLTLQILIFYKDLDNNHDYQDYMYVHTCYMSSFGEKFV